MFTPLKNKITIPTATNKQADGHLPLFTTDNQANTITTYTYKQYKIIQTCCHTTHLKRRTSDTPEVCMYIYKCAPNICPIVSEPTSAVRRARHLNLVDLKTIVEVHNGTDVTRRDGNYVTPPCGASRATDQISRPTPNHCRRSTQWDRCAHACDIRCDVGATRFTSGDRSNNPIPQTTMAQNTSLSSFVNLQGSHTHPHTHTHTHTHTLPLGILRDLYTHLLYIFLCGVRQHGRQSSQKKTKKQ